MSETMTIKSLAPWFGGKRTLAPAIVRELGVHHQYFEPFCGSMAVLFAKPPCRAETVNDLHGDLTNLARVVQSEEAPRLYERLQRTLVCEGILDEAQEHLTSGIEPKDPLARAFWYFVASWMGRNGVSGTDRTDYQLAVRWTAGGGTPTVRFGSAVGSLPVWHHRLRNVVILERDAFEIIPRFQDSAGTAIYADPPYPAETRGKHRYRHEFDHDAGDGLFAADDDHARLAKMLRAFEKSRVVISSYDCERIRTLYDGWRFVDCTTTKQLQQQNERGRRGGADAPEVLIVNGLADDAQ